MILPDGVILPLLDDAQISVDALVAENNIEDYVMGNFDTFSQVSRSSTPSIIPGFGLPHAHPSIAFREDAVAMAVSRIVPTSTPFTPRNIIPGTITSLSQIVTPTRLSHNTLRTQDALSQAKNSKALATNPPSLKAAKPSNTPPSALQSEHFPALESVQGKERCTATLSKVVNSAPVNAAKMSAPIAIAQLISDDATNRAAPSLNISVPAKTNSKTALNTDSSKKSPSSAFPPLPSNTNSAVQSPLSRNVPKTLRLTSTPKPETPSNGCGTPSSVTSVPPPHFPTSRQPSLASIARMDRPGTPTSEIISDNASITSTSFSRASSPPQSRIGSAPVRATTKSSQKKQRQAQKEKDRAEIEAAVIPVAEVEIAPIMGRKKKKKKERIQSATGESTPVISRSSTPSPAPGVVSAEKDLVEPGDNAEVAEKQGGTESQAKKTSSKGSDLKGKGKGKPQVSVTREPIQVDHLVGEEPAEKSLPTPASVLGELLASGLIKDVNDLYLLKHPISSSYRHQDIPDKVESLENINHKLKITPEDRADLLAGKAVHKNVEAGYPIMLTPNGECVRNLSQVEERRYLELQDQIAKHDGPTAFVSAKHTGKNGFSLIGGRAVPNGLPSLFPSPCKGTSAVDPVTKIQREEALSYINQYVLPSLSCSNAQLEKAFNGSDNVLEGDILRPSSVDSAWSAWGPDSTHCTGDFYMSNVPKSGGMLENMTTHFAIGSIGGELGRGQPLGNVTLLSLSDAESAMQLARKEAESLEKKLNALIKKNRRLLLGAGH